MADPYYFGTRDRYATGDTIAPARASTAEAPNAKSEYVHLSSSLDAAIWAAEIAAGEGPARVYVVQPTGPVEAAAEPDGSGAPPHLAMSLRSSYPLRVAGEVTEWLHYHGTRANLRIGDLIKPGHTANFGNTARTTTYVYFTRTIDAATWGAELAAGEGGGRIYVVEPTGSFEDDPNLTNKRFRGNPTKSFRSREPLRVTGEIEDWERHSAEAVENMKSGLERLKRLGIEPIDD